MHFRTTKNFDFQHVWKIKDDMHINIYAKINGKAGSENKYDLPPPIDSELYFGNMALVACTNSELNDEDVCELTKEKCFEYQKHCFRREV